MPAFAWTTLEIYLQGDRPHHDVLSQCLWAYIISSVSSESFLLGHETLIQNASFPECCRRSQLPMASIFFSRGSGQSGHATT
jgi:hypothetical protein